MWIGTKNAELIVKRALYNALREAEGQFVEQRDFKRDILKLKTELSELLIEKSRKDEEFAKREREIEHKVGLERKRQEFEIQQAKRETTVNVREENLEADKERFKSEMDFQRQHLQGEIASLRDLVNNMLKRLPSAEIYATMGDK